MWNTILHGVCMEEPREMSERSWASYSPGVRSLDMCYSNDGCQRPAGSITESFLKNHLMAKYRMWIEQEQMLII